MARRAGRVIVVPFTIPGERVRVEVRRTRDSTLAGVLDEVLEPSPHRVEPGCPHFGAPRAGEQGGHWERGCGGCTWQHIAYPEQLRLKSELVTRLVRAALPRSPAARPTLTGTPIETPWGYRHKVHFVFDDTPRSRLTMGHYARGSRRVIPVVACPVHDERGNALAFQLRDTLKAARIQPGREPAPKGIAVRASATSTELMATLVLSADADRRLRSATQRFLDTARPASFHVNIHPKGDAYVFGRTTRRLAGSERLRDQVRGTSFLISPTSFFQTNVRAAEILVDLVSSAIATRSRVLDLYAGSGLFALPLARAGHEVVAVEENRDAVADGEASRRLNGIPEGRCTFMPRRVEDALYLRAVRSTERRSNQPFDVVILDPPRAGCSPQVVDGVFGTLTPAQAIYVSCNPEALARDLRAITSFGYAVSSIQPVDMFPHTAHVESVVVLSRSD